MHLIWFVCVHHGSKQYELKMLKVLFWDGHYVSFRTEDLNSSCHEIFHWKTSMSKRLAFLLSDDKQYVGIHQTSVVFDLNWHHLYSDSWEHSALLSCHCCTSPADWYAMQVHIRSFYMNLWNQSEKEISIRWKETTVTTSGSYFSLWFCVE